MVGPAAAGRRAAAPADEKRDGDAGTPDDDGKTGRAGTEAPREGKTSVGRRKKGRPTPAALADGGAALRWLLTEATREELVGLLNNYALDSSGRRAYPYARSQDLSVVQSVSSSIDRSTSCAAVWLGEGPGCARTSERKG